MNTGLAELFNTFLLQNSGYYIIEKRGLPIGIVGANLVFALGPNRVLPFRCFKNVSITKSCESWFRQEKAAKSMAAKV